MKFVERQVFVIKYLLLLLPLIFSCACPQANNSPKYPWDSLSSEKKSPFVDTYHCPEATKRVAEFKTWKVERTESFIQNWEPITWAFVYNPSNPEEKVLLAYSDDVLFMVEYAEAEDKTYIEYHFWRFVLGRRERAEGWQYPDYKDIITGEFFCELKDLP